MRAAAVATICRVRLSIDVAVGESPSEFECGFGMGSRRTSIPSVAN